MQIDKFLRIEFAAILISGSLKFILMDWLNMRAFYITGVCLFWLIYIFYRYSLNKNILIYWGFKKENFKKSFLYLSPFIALCIIISLLYAYVFNLQIITWHILPILALYPLWGIFQQFIILALIVPNLAKLTTGKISNIILAIITSLLFSLIHYPSVFLMVFTFFMEVMFFVVYLKWKNLWAIGIAHGWMAAFLLYYFMNRDLWLELFAWF